MTHNDDISQYATESPEFLSHKILAEDFFPEQCVYDGHVSENPIMHLFESFVVGFSVFQQKLFQESAIRLLKIIDDHFYVSTAGLIREVVSRPEDVWFEPGHSFEWVSLMKMAHLSITSDIRFSAKDLLVSVKKTAHQ